MAREVAEVKSEQKELRKLLLRRTSMAEVNNNTEDIGLPAFQKHVALPLQSVEDFKYFEEELLKEDVRKNLVREIFPCREYGNTPRGHRPLVPSIWLFFLSEKRYPLTGFTMQKNVGFRSG